MHGISDALTDVPVTGALFTHLAPTAIILPSYFVLADVVLILQCLYYNNLNKRRAAARLQEEVAEASEDSPLLRRSSSFRSRDAEEPTKLPTDDDAEAATGTANPWVNNTLSLLAVYGVGCAAWFISYKAGAWDTKDPAPDAPEETENPLEIAGLTLGYISAVCYLWYDAL